MIARVAGLLAAAAALALSTVVAATPAHADAIGLCTATKGTIVAVDFSHWGGPIVRGCGVDSKTGYELLHDGGFTTAGDQHDGPAFICRLGNGAFHGGTQYPTPEQDDCVLTPPASAYWSYWLAPRGQNTWSYSQLGAMSEVPRQGEVELWQFGGTNIAGTEGRPTVQPDQLRAKNTSPVGASSTPRTTAAPTHRATQPVGQPTRASGTVAGHTSARPAPGAHTSADRGSTVATPPASSGSDGSVATSTHPSSGAHSSSAPATQTTSTAAGRSTAGSTAPGNTSAGSTSTAASSSAATTADGSSTTPAIVDASPAGANTAQPAPGSGSPTALIVGGGLAVVLAAGAGWTIVRRRRLDPDA